MCRGRYVFSATHTEVVLWWYILKRHERVLTCVSNCPHMHTRIEISRGASCLATAPRILWSPIAPHPTLDILTPAWTGDCKGVGPQSFLCLEEPKNTKLFQYRPPPINFHLVESGPYIVYPSTHPQLGE